MMLIKALQRILNDLQMFLHAGFWSLIRLLQPKNDKQGILRDKKGEGRRWIQSYNYL